MHCCSRLQASESLQSKLSCVLRTWAYEVTKKPTSSTKTEKRRRSAGQQHYQQNYLTKIAAQQMLRKKGR